MNRIENKFKALKRQNRKAFIVFITAGYPSLKATRKLIIEFARVGADIIELGVPFSDPLADGPIIQEASQEALEKHTNLAGILDLVKGVRRETDIPICLMTYYNPVFRFGEDDFLKKARSSGVDGVIIPDLPPEEGLAFARQAAGFGIDVIFFLSPTSTAERIRLVSRSSRGFIYYVSLTGVTGPRRELASGIRHNLQMIKKQTQKPVCVGFGVSNPQQVEQVSRIADGVIVGSAVIGKIRENLGRPDMVRRAGEFVCRLKGARCTRRQP